MGAGKSEDAGREDSGDRCVRDGDGVGGGARGEERRADGGDGGRGNHDDGHENRDGGHENRGGQGEEYDGDAGAWGVRGIAALGVLYVLLAVVRAYVVVSRGARVPGQVLNVGLVVLPAAALVYGGFWLRRTDVHPNVYPRVAGWSLLGGGLMVGVIVLVELTPGGGIENIVLAVLLFGALGSLGGFAIGLNEAHAITRARDLEREHRAVERYSHRLQRQNERLESFTGMLAHELRNPLNIAQIYVGQVGSDDQSGELDEAREQVERALARMEEMIDVLLVIARGQDASIDRETVSLDAVAREAWADLSPEAATLRVETDATIPADPVHVRHLFENLFGNAIEHGREDATIRVGDLPDADGFYVADDGPGIPAEERDEVFDAGYTTRPDGTGLGLTFIAQLAEAYGWDYAITESESGGARFEFSDVGRVETPERKLE